MADRSIHRDRNTSKSDDQIKVLNTALSVFDTEAPSGGDLTTVTGERAIKRTDNLYISRHMNTIGTSR